MRVLLWDIDGTLINSDGAGMYAWLQALEEENGRTLTVGGMNLAGLTDRIIARISIGEILRREYSEALADRLIERYVELLPQWLERRTDGYVMPGVRAILERAQGLSDTALALLTGNVESGARLKLEHYGLLDFFEWGAFADGAIERRDIAGEARRIAEERYGADSVDSLFVIGDTAHDIDCGKFIGAHTVAVGTGSFTAAKLAAHDPWWAIEQLPAARLFFARLDALGDG